MKTSILSDIFVLHMGQSVTCSSFEQALQRQRCLQGSKTTRFVASSQMMHKFSSSAWERGGRGATGWLGAPTGADTGTVAAVVLSADPKLIPTAGDGAVKVWL